MPNLFFFNNSYKWHLHLFYKQKKILQIAYHKMINVSSFISFEIATYIIR